MDKVAFQNCVGFVKALCVAGSFFAVGLFVEYSLSPPLPIPADALAEEFSALRAMRHIKEIAKEPHPLGSAANEAVRNYILDTLREMHVEAETQTSRHVQNKTIFVTTNVIGRIPGTASGKAFMMMAHFDSVPYGPGAADDGAGVAALLETARALRAGRPLKNDVIFAFTDGEEAGEAGASKLFASRWADRTGVVLNLEARGCSGPSLLFETSRNNGWIMSEAAKAGVSIRASSLMAGVYRSLPFNSDFSIARDRGLQGFNVAFVDDFRWYHTKNDSSDHLSLASLQNHGSYALGFAKHFGNLPLDGDLAKPDMVYFNVAGSTLVSYPEAWSGSIAWASGIMFALAVLLGAVRGRMTISGFLGGILAFALAAVASAFVVLLALAAVYGPGKLFTQYASGATRLPDLIAVSHNALYGWAFAALTVSVFMICYQGFVSRLRSENLAAGALFWWALCLLGMQCFLPSGSYLAAWPLLFAALGLAVSFLGRKDEPASMRAYLLGVFAVPGLVLVVPAYSTFLATVLVMTAPALSLLMSLILGLIVPQILLVVLLCGRRLAICLGCLGAAMLIYGAVNSGPSPERPRLNSLAYGMNFDTGRAAWFSYDGELDEWTSRFFTADGARPRRGAITEFISTDKREYWKAPAPVAAYEAPQAKIVEDVVTAEGRIVTIHISMKERPLEVTVRLTSDADVRSAEVFGQKLEGGGKGWSVKFRGFPSEGTDVRFVVARSDRLTLEVGATLLGLPNFAGASVRPDYMAVEPNTIRRPWSFRGDTTFLVRTVDFR